MPKFTLPPLYLPWNDALRELGKFIPESDLRDAQYWVYYPKEAKLQQHSVPSVQGPALHWLDVERLWPRIAGELYVESLQPLRIEQQRSPARDTVRQQRRKPETSAPAIEPEPLPAKKQPTTQQIRKHKLTDAINARLKTGHWPPPWPKFCDDVRSDLKVARDTYGYSDKTIQRIVPTLKIRTLSGLS
jgi:hypothetical protein